MLRCISQSWIASVHRWQDDAYPCVFFRCGIPIAVSSDGLWKVSLAFIFIVQTPPLVGGALWPALRRILPGFLSAIRGEVKQPEVGIEQFATASSSEVGTICTILIVTNENVDGESLTGIECIGKAPILIGIPRGGPVHTL